MTYCETYSMKCPTMFGTDYTDEAGCLEACAGMTPGTPGEASGDTVECRISHAMYAAGTDDADHCPHASEAGTGGCE